MKKFLFIAMLLGSCQVIPDESSSPVVSDTVVSTDTIVSDSVAVDTISVDSLAE